MTTPPQGEQPHAQPPVPPEPPRGTAYPAHPANPYLRPEPPVPGPAPVPYGQAYPGNPYPGGPFPGTYPAVAPPPVTGRHQAARPAMVVGIVSLVGIPLAGLSLFLAPFALGLGLTARREILASGGSIVGLDSARAGVIMGIIGSVLLALLPVALVVLAVLAQVGASTL